MRAIVAKIKVKEGQEADFETVAAGLVETSRREPGCLAYDLWRSDDAGEYVFIERYVDEDAARAHVKSDHYRRIGRQMGAFMEGVPTVYRLSASREVGEAESAAGRQPDEDGLRQLVSQWLTHFGVDEAKDLDLGTLEAIRRYVIDGVQPPERAAEA